MTFNKLDLDDLRCATALDTTRVLDEEADLADENNVIALLGLQVEDPSPSAIAAENMLKTIHQNPRSVLEALSQELCFTLEEVQTKHMLFSDDLQTTRDFFNQCRKMINAFFESYYRIHLGGASEQLKNEIDARFLQITPDPSFPAENTRAKKAAREEMNNRQRRKEEKRR